MAHQKFVELAAIPTAYRWVLLAATAIIIGSLLTLAWVYSPPARRARAKARGQVALPAGETPFELLGTRLARLVEEQEAAPVILNVVIPSALPPEPSRTGPAQQEKNGDESWLLSDPPSPIVPPPPTPASLPFVAQGQTLHKEPSAQPPPVLQELPSPRRSEPSSRPHPRGQPLLPHPNPEEHLPTQAQPGRGEEEGTDPPPWVQKLTLAGLLKPANPGAASPGVGAQVVAPSIPESVSRTAALDEQEADETEGARPVRLDLSALAALPEDEVGEPAGRLLAAPPLEEELRADEEESDGVLEAVDLSRVLWEEMVPGEEGEVSDEDDAILQVAEQGEEEQTSLAPEEPKAEEEHEAWHTPEVLSEDSERQIVEEAIAPVASSDEIGPDEDQAPDGGALARDMEERATRQVPSHATSPSPALLRLEGFGEPALLVGGAKLPLGQQRALELVLVLAHAATEHAGRVGETYLTRLSIADALWPSQKDEDKPLTWVRTVKGRVVTALKAHGVPEEALFVSGPERQLALAPEVSTDMGDLMQLVTTLTRLSQTPKVERATSAPSQQEVLALAEQLRQLYKHGFARGLGKKIWLDQARSWYHTRYQQALVNAAKVLECSGDEVEAVEIVTNLLRANPNQLELVQLVLTWLRPGGQAAVTQWIDGFSSGVEQEGKKRLSARVSQLLFEARLHPSS